MKKVYSFFFALMLTATAFAQVPQKMSYQAVIRDASNNLVKSMPVAMKISILQGSETGTPVYIETQTLETNANGLLTIEIGEGTITTGTFAGIDWSVGPYFIKTETDPNGGTSYSMAGTSQLLSVPYALYAKKTENIDALMQQIKNLQDVVYTQLPLPTIGLVVYYPFNGNTNDESGKGFNANNLVGTSFTKNRLNQEDKALLLNGTSDYAYTDNNNAFDNLHSGTVSFWINTSTILNDEVVLAYSTNNTLGSLFVFGISQGKAYAQYKQDEYGHNPVWIGSIAIQIDQWIHIAFVADGNNMMKIYVNGRADNVVFDPNYTTANGSEWFGDVYGISTYDHFISIGALRRGEAEAAELLSLVKGTIDDIRVYDKALSEGEIIQLYHEAGYFLP